VWKQKKLEVTVTMSRGMAEALIKASYLARWAIDHFEGSEDAEPCHYLPYGKRMVATQIRRLMVDPEQDPAAIFLAGMEIDMALHEAEKG
jgi:hypothetical protein